MGGAVLEMSDGELTICDFTTPNSLPSRSKIEVMLPEAIIVR